MKKDYGYKGAIPQEVSPRDDAFHGLTKSKTSEWWYFEAVLDNDYSVVFSFTTSLKNLIAFPTIEIYKNGKFEKRAFILFCRERIYQIKRCNEADGKIEKTC